MGSNVILNGGAYIRLVILLLILPINWVIAAIAAALFHELSHYTALRVLNIPVHRLEILGFGARMETGEMSEKEELLCALAGPAGSFLLLTFARWIPRIALCALIQGIFNLLPVKNLDGGRALRCAWALVFGKKPCKQGKEGVQ